MRQRDAERRTEPAERRDHAEARKIHVAHGEGRQDFAGWQLREQVTERTRYRNQQTEQRGRADGAVYGHAAERKGRHAQRAAADAHHRGDGADCPGQQRPAGAAGHGLAQHPALERQQHADCSQCRDGPEHERERAALHSRGEHRTEQGAERDRHGPAAYDAVVDRSLAGMPACGREACRHDDRHRGRHGHVQRDGRGDAGRGQGEIERRHHHDSAAHAEESRQHPGDDAGPGQRDHQRQPLEHGHQGRSASSAGCGLPGGRVGRCSYVCGMGILSSLFVPVFRGRGDCALRPRR